MKVKILPTIEHDKKEYIIDITNQTIIETEEPYNSIKIEDLRDLSLIQKLKNLLNNFSCREIKNDSN